MELSAVAAAVVIAAIAACKLVRSRYRERRDRARVIIRQLPTYVGLERVVLRRLRSRQLRRKELLVLLGNLRVLCSQFLRRQSLVNAAEAAVHRVDDVASAVLHLVASVAGLRREVVIDALNSLSGLAAAVCSLHRHCSAAA